MTESRSNFARRTLFRLLILGVIAVIILLGNYGFINELYIKHQQTPVGLIINGGILAVFLLGLVKLVLALLHYMNEEAALARFERQLAGEPGKVLKRINPKSVIARRYTTLQMLGKKYTRINHSALASTLVANESTRVSFARYVSNILILTGVFGTIVSLSVALVGASNLLDSAQGTGDMGLVIHGMSTALSTTITAILCYLFYGYFYLKLMDVQTHFLSSVEELTAVYLIPMYSKDSESMLHEVAGLIHGLREATTGMQGIQQEYAEAGTRLQGVATELGQRIETTATELKGIKKILRDGFRLPAAGD